MRCPVHSDARLLSALRGLPAGASRTGCLAREVQSIPSLRVRESAEFYTLLVWGR